jgi:hypothetical protein
MFMGVSDVVTAAYPVEAGGTGTAHIAVRNADFAHAADVIATALNGCP